MAIPPVHSMTRRSRWLLAAALCAWLAPAARADAGAAMASLDFDLDFGSTASGLANLRSSQFAGHSAPMSTDTVFGNVVNGAPLPWTSLEKSVSSTTFANGAASSANGGRIETSVRSASFESAWSSFYDGALFLGDLTLAPGDSVTVRWRWSISATRFDGAVPNGTGHVYPSANARVALLGDFGFDLGERAGWNYGETAADGEAPTRSSEGSFSRTIVNDSGADLHYLLQAEAGLSAALTQVAAVPEPGTWAMWIAGLAGLGALLQRRTATGRSTA